MNKKEWLNQNVMVDEWGRPPSLADVPLTFMTRAETFKKRNMDKEEIDRIWNVMKEYGSDKTDLIKTCFLIEKNVLIITKSRIKNEILATIFIRKWF